MASADIQRLGRHRHGPPRKPRRPPRRRRARLVVALTAALGVLAAAAFAVYSVGFSARPSQRDPFALPATPASYVGCTCAKTPVIRGDKRVHDRNQRQAWRGQLLQQLAGTFPERFRQHGGQKRRGAARAAGPG